MLTTRHSTFRKCLTANKQIHISRKPMSNLSWTIVGKVALISLNWSKSSVQWAFCSKQIIKIQNTQEYRHKCHITNSYCKKHMKCFTALRPPQFVWCVVAWHSHRSSDSKLILSFINKWHDLLRLATHWGMKMLVSYPIFKGSQCSSADLDIFYTVKTKGILLKHEGEMSDEINRDIL